MTVDKPDFRSNEYFYTIELSNPRYLEGVVVSEENIDKALKKLFKVTQDGTYRWSVEDIKESQVTRSTPDELYSAYSNSIDYKLLFNVDEEVNNVYSSNNKFYMIQAIDTVTIDYFVVVGNRKPSELKGELTKGDWKVATSGVIDECIRDGYAVRDIVEAARMEKEGTIVTEGTFDVILEDAKQEAEEQNSEWEEHQYLDYQSKVIENVFDRFDVDMEDLSYEQRERIKEAISETANLMTRR